MPYDHFIKQQLAGDELEPDNLEAIIATGLNRLYPDEYNAGNLEQRRQEILDDITDTTGFAFLGMTFACARCHDHKFDPTLQKDYYRLQAFFSGFRTRDDIPALDHADSPGAMRTSYGPGRMREGPSAKRWSNSSPRSVRNAKHSLEKPCPEILECVNTPPEKRTPFQWQIALMAEKQASTKGLPTKTLTDKSASPTRSKFRYLELGTATRQPRQTEQTRQPPPCVMSIGDLGREAAPVHLLSRAATAVQAERTGSSPVSLRNSRRRNPWTPSLPALERRQHRPAAPWRRWLTRMIIR